MTKALQYFKTEYGYDEFDLMQHFGSQYIELKDYILNSELNEPKTKTEEDILFKIIDDFMTDTIQQNKRRRRSY